MRSLLNAVRLLSSIGWVINMGRWRGFHIGGTIRTQLLVIAFYELCKDYRLLLGELRVIFATPYPHIYGEFLVSFVYLYESLSPVI